MPVNYALAVRNSRLQQVESAIDAGSGNGVLRLLDGFGNILSTVTLAKPAGTVTAGVLQFSGLTLLDPGAAGTGVAAAGRVEDSAGNIVFSGLSVGTSSANDIVLAPTAAIVAGQAIALQQASITGN
jgi:hypothetical protein